MKKILLIILAISACGCGCVHAQQPIPIHSITLSFGASLDQSVTQYQISRSTVKGGPYDISQGCIAKPPALSCTDTNVSSGTTYFYVGQAFDPLLGWSVVSNEASATIPKNTDPLTPPQGSQQQLNITSNK